MKRFVLFLLLSVWVTTVFGQTQKKSITDSLFNIDEVTVMEKRKKSETMGLNVPLRFVPMSISTLSSDVLERKGIVDFSDALKFLPGVVERQAQYDQFQQFSIRGQGTAVVMMDGIRDERTFSNSVPYGDLSAAESIELLKGPASILSGHSAMGGVLNVVRKKTSPVFTANARVGYGSWDEKRASFGMGGRLAGPVDFRANFHFSNGDGFRRVTADRLTLYGALGSDLGDFGRLDVSGGYSKTYYTTEIGGAPIMPGDMYFSSNDSLFAYKGERHPTADYKNAVYNDLANNFMKREVSDISVDYTHRITDFMKLRERFTFSHSDLNYHCIESISYLTSSDAVYDWYYMSNDTTRVYVNLDTVRRGGSRTNPLNFNPDHKNTNNILELTGDVSTSFIRHHYRLGWHYSHFNMTQYNGYLDGDLWGTGLNALISVHNPQINQGWWDCKISAATIRVEDNNAVYLHDVLEFSDKWKVMLAGRYDWFRRKNASATVDDGRQGYKKENRGDWTKVKQSAFTYKVGAVYFPIPELSVFASSASFFAPVTGYSYSETTMYLDRHGKEFDPEEETMFDPEKGVSAEFGTQYNISDKFEISLSLFYINRYNTVKNLGDTVVPVNGVAETKNIRAQVGRSDTRGFDVELTYRPLPTLQVVGGLGWSDYRIREISKSGRFSNFSESTMNKRSTGVPRMTFYVYGDYTVPTGFFKDLSFHLSGNLKDKVFSNVTDRVYFPSLWLMDAGVFYTVQNKVTLALNVNNLFDKEYFRRNTVMGKPRNYEVSLSYRF